MMLIITTCYHIQAISMMMIIGDLHVGRPHRDLVPRGRDGHGRGIVVYQYISHLAPPDQQHHALCRRHLDSGHSSLGKQGALLIVWKRLGWTPRGAPSMGCSTMY